MDSSPAPHVWPGKAVPPLLPCFVEGREHHALENEHFAKLVRESRGRARVVSATGRTHVGIEAEIGTQSDAVKEAIQGFLGGEAGRARESGGPRDAPVKP